MNPDPERPVGFLASTTALISRIDFTKIKCYGRFILNRVDYFGGRVDHIVAFGALISLNLY